MPITRAIVKNYRTLRSTDISFNSSLNIIVGDNETGKSTLLEAINLALRCQLNRKPAVQELYPHLVNVEAVKEFIEAHKKGKFIPPPSILIEVYFADTADLAPLKGTNNSLGEDVPGIRLSIELDEQFNEEFKEYVSDPEQIRSVPIEYYYCDWRSFADEVVTVRSIPFCSALIDPASLSNTYAANKYVLEVVRDFLTKKQKVDLSLTYRKMRDIFLEDSSVSAINDELAKQTGAISDKVLSLAMDTSSRASWETGVLPQLDEIPLTLVGKGEQNAIKIKLALAAESETDLLLLEEPENHLSHSNLNRLIEHINSNIGNRQLIMTTHSSFVLNKLGIDHVLLFNGESAMTLNELPSDTKKYFMKLPGHDTLRMVLSSRSIFVEGPSDELIVQKAYYQTHKKLPLDDGIEVITVNSLAFKRFLDIAKILKINVHVITDNDGNVAAVKTKYKDYAGIEGISICFDEDEGFKTLEPQLLKKNGREKLNKVLGTKFPTDEILLSYMLNNKTEVALKIFESETNFDVPDYIANAIK